jgi:hypothetical protein
MMSEQSADQHRSRKRDVGRQTETERPRRQTPTVNGRLRARLAQILDLFAGVAALVFLVTLAARLVPT